MPWAIYFQLGGNPFYPKRGENDIKVIEENFESFSKGLLRQKEKSKEIEQLLRNFDYIEKNWKEFPYLYEIEFDRILLEFVFGEKKEDIIRRANFILEKEKNERIKKIVEKIISITLKEYIKMQNLE